MQRRGKNVVKTWFHASTQKKERKKLCLTEKKIIQYNQTICRYCDFLNFLRRHNQIGGRLFSWMYLIRKRWSRGGACCKKKHKKKRKKTHGPLLMLLTSILSINSWWVISLLHNYMTLTYHPIQWSTQWCIPIFFCMSMAHSSQPQINTIFAEWVSNHFNIDKS